jgi:two-component system, NtrC family, response regulator AtoC
LIVVKTQNSRCTILVGEDELEVRAYLEMALKCLGFSVESAQDGAEVISCLESPDSNISAVLLDIMMPQQDGIDTLKEIRRIDPNLPVIMVSGASSTLNVVTAMKCGATDFLCKPVAHDDLQKAINKALEYKQVPQVMPVKAPSSKNGAFIAESQRMKEIQALVANIGWSETPILIQGETGSGKEVLARQLHANSPRAGKIFLKLNCAALPSELVESELFGYERGAFTGAFQKRAGMFEIANGGTLLLDEIGDMDVRLQAKLLQVLQDHEFQRIGGKEVIKVDVRIMAATHRDLEKAILDRTFREDLYYRLNVINVQLPPLRERKEDIVPLAECLLKKHAVAGTQVPVLTMDLKHALMTYHWPGNVRELENMVRKLLVLRDAGTLIRELRAKATRKPLLSAEVSSTTAAEAAPIHAPRPVREPILEQVTKAKQQAEIEAILAALDSTRWNRKQAAALLQIDYKALLYKMKKLGVEGRSLPFAPQEDGLKVASAGHGF